MTLGSNPSFHLIPPVWHEQDTATLRASASLFFKMEIILSSSFHYEDQMREAKHWAHRKPSGTRAIWLLFTGSTIVWAYIYGQIKMGSGRGDPHQLGMPGLRQWAMKSLFYVSAFLHFLLLDHSFSNLAFRITCRPDQRNQNLQSQTQALGFWKLLALTSLLSSKPIYLFHHSFWISPPQHIQNWPPALRSKCGPLSVFLLPMNGISQPIPIAKHLEVFL